MTEQKVRKHVIQILMIIRRMHA